MKTFHIRCNSCSNEETTSTLEQFKEEYLSKFHCSNCGSSEVGYFEKDIVSKLSSGSNYNRFTGTGDIVGKMSDEMKYRLEHLKTIYPRSTIQTK